MEWKREETGRVVRYVERKYGTRPEFLWKRTPGNAVFRHASNAKWFAALLMETPREKLGLPGAGQVDILDLKCDPKLAGSLLDGVHYLPGYHMNKEHWITVVLDGTLSWDEVFSLIDLSYRMTGGKGETE